MSIGPAAYFSHAIRGYRKELMDLIRRDASGSYSSQLDGTTIDVEPLHFTSRRIRCAAKGFGSGRTRKHGDHPHDLAIRISASHLNKKLLPRVIIPCITVQLEDAR